MNHSLRYIGAFSALALTLSCGEQTPKKGKSPQLEALQKSDDFTDSVSLSLTSLVATNGLSSVTRLRDCTEEEKNRFFTNTGALVMPACSLTFDNASQVLKRSIRFIGSAVSGSVLDCKGGKIQPPVTSGQTIVVASKLEGSIWSIPKNITIKNCVIMGATHVYGMGVNGEATLVRESSRKRGHTQRAQAAAPLGIHILKNKITANITSPIYFGPGVTYSTIESNSINGNSNSVSIYLDAESGRNHILRNSFGVQSANREVIAVDGSRLNTIAGNFISGLTFGGIFVYRNCGEGGTVRHQPPTHNAILNNFFYYDKATNSSARPAVHLASRNGSRGYCGEDNGFPWGSSASNLDLADKNLVADNQIRKLSSSSVIRNNGTMNVITRNSTVSERQVVRSGCSKFSGFDKTIGFIGDGQSTAIEGKAFLCQDGKLVAK